MFLCTYIVPYIVHSSCVTFSVFFATRASIICIDSGTCDTIRVSLALAIRFIDISINRYTPNIRKTKWYRYADHLGCIRVNFGQSTG